MSESAGRILRARELAQLIGVSTDTLCRWRRSGEGPRWQRIGPRLVGYPEAGILVGLERQRQKTEEKP